MNSSSTSVIGTLGSIIAAVISYAKWHSIGWAILHAIFGWFYVIYYAIVY